MPTVLPLDSGTKVAQFQCHSGISPMLIVPLATDTISGVNPNGEFYSDGLGLIRPIQNVYDR